MLLLLLLLLFYAIATRYFYKQFCQLTGDGVKQLTLPAAGTTLNHRRSCCTERTTWQLSDLNVNVDVDVDVAEVHFEVVLVEEDDGWAWSAPGLVS